MTDWPFVPRNWPFDTPWKAGIQARRGNLGRCAAPPHPWIPASAGMTGVRRPRPFRNRQTSSPAPQKALPRPASQTRVPLLPPASLSIIPVTLPPLPQLFIVSATLPSFPRNRPCQNPNFGARKASPSFPRKRESRGPGGVPTRRFPRPTGFPLSRESEKGPTSRRRKAPLGWGLTQPGKWESRGGAGAEGRGRHPAAAKAFLPA